MPKLKKKLKIKQAPLVMIIIKVIDKI